MGKAVVKARCIKRMNPELRNKTNTLGELKGVPWQPNPDSSDKEVKVAIKIDRPEDPGNLPSIPAFPGKELKDAKRVYILREDLEKFGYSVGCPGCNAAREGRKAVGHFPECRKRIEEEMAKTDEGQKRLKAVVEKKADAGAKELERLMEEQERKEKRRKLTVQTKSPEEKAEDTPMQETAQEKRKGAELEDVEDRAKKVRSEIQKIETRIRSRSEPPSSSSSSSSGAGPPPKTPRRSDTPRVSAEADAGYMELLDANSVEEANSVVKAMDFDHDVSELYNPNVFCNRAKYFGLRPGYAFDMTQPRESDGQPWDFRRHDHRRDAYFILRKDRPLLLVGSPVCTAFSQIMALNWDKMAPEERGKMIHEGVEHLKFVCSMYKWQHRDGRLFLHEHPWGAWSWKLECVQDLLNSCGVRSVRSDMCRFNMTSVDVDGTHGLVLKPTGWMGNCNRILDRLDKRCFNTIPGHIKHRHVHLVSGRAKAAEVYPPRLLNEILQGLKATMVEQHLLSVDSDNPGGVKGPSFCEAPKIDWSLINPDPKDEYDAVTGVKLDPILVQKAKEEELKGLYSFPVYAKCSLDECFKETGKGPIGVRWAVVNKGDSENPEIRARLVTKDFKANDPNNADFFAATPPLESLRIFMS